MAKAERISPLSSGSSHSRLLLRGADALEHLHVAGVGSRAVERLGAERVLAELDGDVGVVEVAQAADLGVGQEEVPEPFLLGLGLGPFERLELTRRVGPPVGAALARAGRTPPASARPRPRGSGRRARTAAVPLRSCAGRTAPLARSASVSLSAGSLGPPSVAQRTVGWVTRATARASTCRGHRRGPGSGTPATFRSPACTGVVRAHRTTREAQWF